MVLDYKVNSGARENVRVVVDGVDGVPWCVFMELHEVGHVCVHLAVGSPR